MKNNKKIIIGLVSALALASLILIIFIPKKEKVPTLEEQLSEIAVNYYEEDFKDKQPLDILKQYGEVQIDLDMLKGSRKDITIFEEKNCDMEETYVTLVYNENKKDKPYDVKVHMSCEE